MISMWVTQMVDRERKEMNKKQVNLWLPSEDVAALDRIAKERKRSRSNLISLVIEEFVRRSKMAAMEGGNEATNGSVRTGDHV